LILGPTDPCPMPREPPYLSSAPAFSVPWKNPCPLETTAFLLHLRRTAGSFLRLCCSFLLFYPSAKVLWSQTTWILFQPTPFTPEVPEQYPAHRDIDIIPKNSHH
jgi:hypothetical protein